MSPKERHCRPSILSGARSACPSASDPVTNFRLHRRQRGGQEKGSALLVGVAAFLKSPGGPVRQDRAPRLPSSPVRRWRRGRRTVVRATAATIVVIVVIVPVAVMRMRLLALPVLLRRMALNNLATEVGGFRYSRGFSPRGCSRFAVTPTTKSLLTQPLYGKGRNPPPSEPPELALGDPFSGLNDYDTGVKPCCYSG